MPIDLAQAKNDISQWVDGFLSVARPELGGHSPCPFAKSAMRRGSVDFRLGTDVVVDLSGLSANWNEAAEAVILIYPTDIDPASFAKAVEHANHHILRPCGLIALEDHPLLPEVIAGISFNQGQHALIIVQLADKLRTASAVLRARGYYDMWSEDEIDDVVSWRW